MTRRTTKTKTATPAPWLDEGDLRLYHGDCRTVMQQLPANSVHAIVTDPPYGLAYQHLHWDTYQDPAAFVEFTRSWAAEALRVLKPGGHLLAFASTRTYHQIATAIEQAGYEIRDQLLWLYATGQIRTRNLATILNSPIEARRWTGWRATLRPACEPIVLARKRLDGQLTDNVLAHQAGALNTDACSITAPPEPGRPPTLLPEPLPLPESVTDIRAKQQQGASQQARAATNVLLDPTVAALIDAERGRPGQAERGFHVLEPDPDHARCWLVPKPARSERGDGNDHPTVKPVALMRHLVRLTTPPDGICLDPFAGSGTTLIALRAESLRGIGIEREDHYLPIIARRLAQHSLLAQPLPDATEGAA